ncbi:MAG: hypothetical protein KKB81_01990 [Candidatus Margulisbacteria bacterium]|nr:hypothetical protein [Candidatus Margulisiibacteriota bacterium]MBU1022552.1 hypothetical protein [Candidatus Margulisiibacteriota bacterium]MBU1728838.1 hypothetical protein [Candidatus Margulisiibacteriota bacterium]MBU1955469.1 hypothetical protein [Candidatus Margulisiibacteriota bacterium]
MISTGNVRPPQFRHQVYGLIKDGRIEIHANIAKKGEKPNHVKVAEHPHEPNKKKA